MGRVAALRLPVLADRRASPSGTRRAWTSLRTAASRIGDMPIDRVPRRARRRGRVHRQTDHRCRRRHDGPRVGDGRTKPRSAAYARDGDPRRGGDRRGAIVRHRQAGAGTRRARDNDPRRTVLSRPGWRMTTVSRRSSSSITTSTTISRSSMRLCISSATATSSAPRPARPSPPGSRPTPRHRGDVGRPTAAKELPRGRLRVRRGRTLPRVRPRAW